MRNLLKAFVAVPLIVSLMNGLPASAVAAEGGPPMECTYDNSIVITATVPAERSFAPADFPEIDCKNAVIAEKVWQDPAFRYRVVLILRDEGDIAVQEAMHSVRNNALVSNVGRNDYVDRDSSMALNESSINLRVGEQKNLTIASLDLVHKNNKQVGVSFSIDPDVIDAGLFEKDSFLSYGVDRFWPDTDKHEHILSDKPDNLEATASDNGTYYGLIDEQRISYLRTIDKLAAVPGVLSASIVYVGIPGGEPDYERWTSSHPEIAGLTLSGGEPDRAGMGTILNQTATVTGLKSGATTILVERGGFNSQATASCTVNVFLPGDVNGDGRVTAEDALLALQAATSKIELNTLQSLSANMDDKETISAEDALVILQIAVGKIRN